MWAKGGEGGIALAEKVLETLEHKPSEFQVLYPDEMGLKDKISTVAREIYGADDVTYSPAAQRALKNIEAMGFGSLPVCMAKTQYSLSDDQTKLGRPRDFTIQVRDAYVSAGAGFVVVLTRRHYDHAGPSQEAGGRQHRCRRTRRYHRPVLITRRLS